MNKYSIPKPEMKIQNAENDVVWTQELLGMGEGDMLVLNDQFVFEIVRVEHKPYYMVYTRIGLEKAMAEKIADKNDGKCIEVDHFRKDGDEDET